ncbi:thioredoxin domain-containing protein [Bacillus safensis]|uniref:thioredoxin domain-containing protein n=1 Tax=Bacillus safensis TaxID=561879 RepID=UPI00227F9EA2|nr:thioredoxin domain-containing protein [Bacillus safensis]MCY7722149.1 thioredoxin domain-containing protein [Bacillus safensis]MED0729172.1 thioredoxin domain-containing protein [Bacillus safensis]
MAHESFEDQQVADILNEHFISIKVDREERPDIDSMYMSVCQMMTGQGGWPLNVFVTPDQKPFYAGTYFPKRSAYGRPGFIEALTQLLDAYHNDRDHIESLAEKATNNLRIKAAGQTEKMLSQEAVHKAYYQLMSSFDTLYGGFGSAPKFPAPHMLSFLMRYYEWTGQENALYAVTKTLDGMANGGIYDHIGSGFSRYSTDEKWLVPHFEKMLYDNALLMEAYTEAYQLTSKPEYKKLVQHLIQFIKQDMMHPGGSFYSAIDADSEGKEGQYYVWSKDEIITHLGEELGTLFCEVYHITEEGNFEGENIPHTISTSFEDIKASFSIDDKTLQSKLQEGRHILQSVRQQRPAPFVDDKVLTSWNALMIAALAKAGRVFDEEEAIHMAKQAMSFLETHLVQHERLMVRYREGDVKHLGFIEDYAHMLKAYMSLYEATFELDWLEKATAIAENMFELFWDKEKGGFFFSGSDAESLLVREKEVYDGAMPSGNSTALKHLLMLSRLTGRQDWLDTLQQMFQAFYVDVSSYPSGHTAFLQGLLSQYATKREIIILGKNGDPQKEQLLQALQKRFVPFDIILTAQTGEELAKLAPFTKDYKTIDGKTTVYICENYSCRQPITDIDEAMEQLFHN